MSNSHDHPMFWCDRCRRPTQSRVKNARRKVEDNTMHRRRQCLECGSRYTTHEVVVPGSFASSDDPASNLTQGENGPPLVPGPKVERHEPLPNQKPLFGTV